VLPSQKNAYYYPWSIKFKPNSSRIRPKEHNKKYYNDEALRGSREEWLLRYLGLHRSNTPPTLSYFVERWKWKEAEEEDQRTQEKGIQRKRYSEAKTVLHHKKMVLKRKTRRRKLRQETGLPGHPTRLPIVQMTGPRILSRLVPNTLPLQ